MNFIRSIFGNTQQDESPPPSAETLAEAKRIFFKYSCNGLFMAQNDVNFSQYRISREQETAWRDEFIAYWKSQLSSDDLTAIQKLGDANAVEAIPDLLAMTDQGDSYVRLRVAEGLWALSFRIKDINLRKKTNAIARKLAQFILDNPLHASESHKLEMAKLGGCDPREYITLFAKNVVNNGKSVALLFKSGRVH